MFDASRIPAGLAADRRLGIAPGGGSLRAIAARMRIRQGSQSGGLPS
jgi:hypothetical protein